MADGDFYSKYTGEEIEKKLDGSVLFNSYQQLTEIQKQQARRNIGAGTVDSGLIIKGYYATYEELTAAQPDPQISDAYGVGTEPPYNIFVWDNVNKMWVNNGTITKGDKGDPGKDGEAPTAENIAAALGYTPAMVNPNLLDNWYFYNPVNQRGHTSGATTYNTYSIDRWKWDYSGGVGSFSIGSDGITLSPASGTTLIFRQMFENPDLLNGKKLTASVLLSTGELFSDTITRANGTSQTFFNVSGRFYVTLNTANAFQVLSTSEISIVAIKLELGSVQTLARQVNGAWVLNEIPDYGEQLARCQRYYQRIVNVNGSAKALLGQAFATTATLANITLSLPAAMRSISAISASGIQISPNIGSNAIDVSSVDAVTSAFPYNTKSINLGGTFTQGQIYSVWLAAGGYIELSADL